MFLRLFYWRLPVRVVSNFIYRQKEVERCLRKLHEIILHFRSACTNFASAMKFEHLELGK